MFLQCSCTLCTPCTTLYSLFSTVLYGPLCSSSVPVLSVLHVLHCTLCSLPFSTVLCVPPVFLYSLYSMYYIVLYVLYRSLLSSVFPQCSCTLCTPCTTLYSLFSTVLHCPLCSLSVPSFSALFVLHCTLCSLPLSTVLCVPPVFLYSLYSMYYIVLYVLYCSLRYGPLCSSSVPVLSVLHILHCSLPFSTVLCVPPVFLYSLYSMYYTVLSVLCAKPHYLMQKYLFVHCASKRTIKMNQVKLCYKFNVLTVLCGLIVFVLPQLTTV